MTQGLESSELHSLFVNLRLSPGFLPSLKQSYKDKVLIFYLFSEASESRCSDIFWHVPAADQRNSPGTLTFILERCPESAPGTWTVWALRLHSGISVISPCFQACGLHHVWRSSCHGNHLNTFSPDRPLTFSCLMKMMREAELQKHHWTLCLIWI